MDRTAFAFGPCVPLIVALIGNSACAVDVADPGEFGSPAARPSFDTGDPDGESGDSAAATSSATGEEVETTESEATFGSGSAGPPTTGGSSGGSDTGGQPPSGAWSECSVPSDCPDPFGCLANDNGSGGVCTATCQPPGDPIGCAPHPTGGSLDCVSLGGTSVCVIPCADGTPCPNGMDCIAAQTDGGDVLLCL